MERGIKPALSAFMARSIVELSQRDTFHIQSISAYGDRLLVGLSTGGLRIYRVNETFEDKGEQTSTETTDDNSPSQPCSSTGVISVDLLQEVEDFSPRAVDQLAIIKESNVLISLSSSYVSIHDLQSYTLQRKLIKAKDATTLAVTSNIVEDSATGIPEIISRLAVAVKNRLFLWSWHELEIEQDSTEITLVESINSLTWTSATKILCGVNSGYLIVDIAIKAIEVVIGPRAPENQGGRFSGVGSASLGYLSLGLHYRRPLATLLAEGETLLVRDINSLFITSEGKPIKRRQIAWQQAPDRIGYSYPYILALFSSPGTLEVRNPYTLSLLQSISLPNAKHLHLPPSAISLAHTGKGFYVASDQCIWRMVAIDYNAQIADLVRNMKYDEAISVLNMLEVALLKDKENNLREIKILKAQMLFDQRKYHDAMDIFMAQDVQAAPERVIKLYPRIIAGDLSMPERNQPSTEPASHEQNGAKTRGHILTTDAMQENVESLQPAAVTRLLSGYRKSMSDESSIRSYSKLKKGDSSNGVKAKPTKEVVIEGKDLHFATQALFDFLVQARTRIQTLLDPETGRIKPVKQNDKSDFPPAFGSLSVTPTSAADREREQKLQTTAKIIDTTLFRAYMLARPQLAAALLRLPNFCDPQVVQDKLLETGRYNDLADFFRGKKLHRSALELLKRVGISEDNEKCPEASRCILRTVGYLQDLSPEKFDLILEFAEWPIRANPTLAIEIFIADSENAKALPRDKVLEFLQHIDPDLVIGYLEHLIKDFNDKTPDFHDRLVERYMHKLKSGNNRDEETWKDLLHRLISFLRSSDKYSSCKALTFIPKEDPAFYEAQAVVFSHKGLHKQVLEIYVFKMQDFMKAQEYCNQLYLIQGPEATSPIKSQRDSSPASDSKDSTPPIYYILLSLYFTPPPPYEPNWPLALDLLSKHSSRLPVLSTLNLIPTTLLITELESYLRTRIRLTTSIINESRVVVGLTKSDVVSAQARLLLGNSAIGSKVGRSRRVVVNNERVCAVCHKRLGRSVIAVLPEHEVVHYGCLIRDREHGPLQ